MNDRKIDDTRPFPIQGHGYGENEKKSSTIPWWLAEIAYEDYEKYGSGQTLERLAERGGFGRQELVALLRQSLKRRIPTEKWIDGK